MSTTWSNSKKTGREREGGASRLLFCSYVLDNPPMRLFVWFLRGLVFFILLGFALKNDAVVTLHFFFDSEWRLPLIVIILFAFAAGLLLGVTAAVVNLLHQRREIRRLKDAQPEDMPLRERPSPVDYPRSI